MVPLFLLLSSALCWPAVVSARVLLGVEISRGAAGTQLQEQLSNALKVTKSAKAELEGRLYHEADVFACFSYDASSATVAVAIPLLMESKVPFFYSTASDNSACTLEYPNNQLSDYSALIHISAHTRHTEISFADMSHWADDSLFALPVSALVEANRVYDSILANSQPGSLSPKRGLINRILMEQHRGFSLLHHLSDLPAQGSKESVPPEHPLFPLFTPASVDVKHESGVCQLWWPLNGSDFVHLPSASKQAEAIHIILACDASVPDSFFIKIAISPEYPTENAPPTNKVHRFSAVYDQGHIGYETPLGFTYSAAFFSPGLASVSIALVSTEGVVLSDFNISLNVISLSELEAPVHAISPSIQQLPIREYLGMFLNSLNLLGTYIEVGIGRGNFAETFLRFWEGHRYVAVDPFEEAIVADYIDGFNSPDKNRTRDMAEYLEKVEPNAHRVTTLRTFSTDAAAVFVDESVDAVFIDAVHHYHMVMQDMQAWWPKVKSGGIMMGHDFHLGAFSNAIMTVKPAALEFGRKMKLPVLHTPMLDSCWYFIKP